MSARSFQSFSPPVLWLGGGAILAWIAATVTLQFGWRQDIRGPFHLLGRLLTSENLLWALSAYVSVACMAAAIFVVAVTPSRHSQSDGGLGRERWLRLVAVLAVISGVAGCADEFVEVQIAEKYLQSPWGALMIPYAVALIKLALGLLGGTFALALRWLAGSRAA